MAGSWSDFQSRDFITYRRFLLDQHLAANTDRMRGVVVDLGGKKKRKRGRRISART